MTAYSRASAEAAATMLRWVMVMGSLLLMITAGASHSGRVGSTACGSMRHSSAANPPTSAYSLMITWDRESTSRLCVWARLSSAR